MRTPSRWYGCQQSSYSFRSNIVDHNSRRAQDIPGSPSSQAIGKRGQSLSHRNDGWRGAQPYPLHPPTCWLQSHLLELSRCQSHIAAAFPTNISSSQYHIYRSATRPASTSIHCTAGRTDPRHCTSGNSHARLFRAQPAQHGGMEKQVSVPVPCGLTMLTRSHSLRYCRQRCACRSYKLGCISQCTLSSGGSAPLQRDACGAPPTCRHAMIRRSPQGAAAGNSIEQRAHCAGRGGSRQPE